MRKNLNPDDLGDLLELPVLAILATNRRDGSVMTSPVWHEWRDGGFTIAIWADDAKSKHLKRDARATVLVAEHAAPYRGIEVRGEATVAARRDLLDTVRRLAIRYLGEADGNDYADASADVALEIVRLEPGNLRAWDFADAV